MVPHVCNDVYAWGAGFVVPLGRKYPKTRQTFIESEKLALGTTQFVQVEPTITVANMIGQHRIYPVNGVPPIRYDALRTCMEQVRDECLKTPGTVIHAPRFGCGLAGGDPAKIDALINELWKDFDVTIYSL
jgi:hypothetical protein